MAWLTKTLSSSLGKKVFMALTGLFLVLFLVVHLAGNLQLLIKDGGESFNSYAYTMGHNPFIRAVSILNFTFIFIHIIWSAMLSRQNRLARGTSYAVSAGSANSSLASRNMGVLGFIILIFLVVHIKTFWFEFKFGSVPMVSQGGIELPNYYLVVNEAYHSLPYVLFYVVCMIFLAFHLSHGFQSAFQTLGLNHVKYTPFIKKLGLGFSILVPLLFALIPIIMYMNNL